jgi:hypothetical protein
LVSNCARTSAPILPTTRRTTSNSRMRASDALAAWPQRDASRTDAQVPEYATAHCRTGGPSILGDSTPTHWSSPHGATPGTSAYDLTNPRAPSQSLQAR